MSWGHSAAPGVPFHRGVAGGGGGGAERFTGASSDSHVASGPNLLINTPLSKMLFEHVRSSRPGNGSGLEGTGGAAGPGSGAAPWGRGSAPAGAPARPPRPTAPRSPALQPNNVFFQAEFVSIIELPATYLKSLAGPLEEQRIARSKSFELFLSPQITEQQAIVVCLNLVTRSDPPLCFLFQSGQDLSAICGGVDPGFKQNAKINISVNK